MWGWCLETLGRNKRMRCPGEGSELFVPQHRASIQDACGCAPGSRDERIRTRRGLLARPHEKQLDCTLVSRTCSTQPHDFQLRAHRRGAVSPARGTSLRVSSQPPTPWASCLPEAPAPRPRATWLELLSQTTQKSPSGTGFFHF